MDVKGKKVERSKAKMAVTVTTRRLVGAANRECEYDILKDLMMDVEKAYDDFCNVNEEFETIVCKEEHAEHRIVNGEDIKTYRDGVYKSYQDARNLFVYVKEKNDENTRRQRLEPVRAALKNNITRIHQLMTFVDMNLDLESVNAHALQIDKNDLQALLNVICEDMTKLCSIEPPEQDLLIQKDVDEVVGGVYDHVRRINLCLHCPNSFNQPLSVGKDNEVNGVQANGEAMTSSSTPSLQTTNTSPLSATGAQAPQSQLDMVPASTMAHTTPPPAQTSNPVTPQELISTSSTDHSINSTTRKPP
jgi:hypothetical protein